MLSWFARRLHQRLLQRLARLQRDTDEILNRAPKSMGGAVNWGEIGRAHV